MPDNAHDLIDERLEAMEREITAIYTRTEAEIEKTADEYFRKFKKLDDQKRRQVEVGKLSEEEYLEWKKNKILYSKRFSEMKQQCAEQILNVNQTAVAYVNGKLPEMYALGYNDLKTAVDGIGGYTFTLISPDTVKRLITDNRSLLPLKAMNAAKDIPWNMKNINAEVLQGILQGESMDKIARRIRNVQEMNRASAIRTARTAVTGAENKGRQDSYKRAEKDGIILKKEWIATFDMRTRHAHALLDGQLADQDKPFKSELGDIMYPGDPDAHPSNVYNCRCTTAAKVYGFDKSKMSNENYADRQTVADWLDEEREKDPETFDKAQKMLYNRAADKEQYENYVARLGRKNMPKGGFKAFQELKYSNAEGYNGLMAFYRYKGRVPEASKTDFEAAQRIKKLGVVGTVRVPALKIDVSNLQAKDLHAFRHGCTIEDAKKYITSAKCSIVRKKWDELHTNFYSEEGATYINANGLINTIFSKDQFDSMAQAIIKELS